MAFVESVTYHSFTNCILSLSARIFFFPPRSVSGCPLADKTLKSLMAANAQELK